MSKTTKTWLVTATALVIVGLIIFASVMSANNWDFAKLSTAEYETNTYEISEKFNSISMNIDTADILFTSSDNDSCGVVCYEQGNIKHAVDVQDGTLIINTVDNREWYEYIGITIGTPRITIYLPETEYNSLSIKESTGDIEIPKDFKFKNVDISSSIGDVKCFACASESIKIKASTGNIKVESLSASTLELSVSTGNVTAFDINCQGDVKINVSTGKTNIANIKCKNVFSNGSTGDISLQNVIATEKFSIKRSTGDVMFDSSDADKIFVITDTGNITGDLLTNKIFVAQTDTGRIDVPKTMTGGKCELITNTGDIKIIIN